MKHTVPLVTLLAAVVLCLATAPAALASPVVPVTPDWIHAPSGHIDAPGDLGYLTKTPSAAQSPVFKTSYPPSYDLRTLGRVTTVKDQGAYGTCWAFAAMGSLESGLLTSDPTVWDFSEDNLVYNAGFSLGTNPYNDGGNSFMALAYLARWGGPVDEADDPYLGGHPTGLAVQRHLGEVVYVAPRTSATDNDDIKKAVMTYGAVDADMYWGDAYYNASTKAYRYTSTASANHDVLIVGWDDGYARTNFSAQPSGDGAFIVRNSWGTGWGASGYFYISYYDTKFAYGGYNMAFADAGPADDYVRAYQYDPLGTWPEDGPYVSGTTSWFANVFTAAATEDLAAVGFYTPLDGCSYEVYSSATSGTPSFAGLTSRGSGTIAEAGYHVVPLATTAPLTSGQPFTVAVKLTVPSTYHYPIPVERPYAGYSAATANSGESYVCTDGSTWRDMTSVTGTGYSETNVCLKAFTAPGAPPAPPVVTSPNGGQEWYIGSLHTVTWTGTGAGTATIELSRDGGVSWPETVVANTVNDGSHNWTVTGPETSNAVVRVTTGQGDDVSDAVFTISTAPPAPAGWSEQASGTTQWLDAVAVADDQHAWAVGSGGTVVTTSDGGTTWTPQSSGTTDDLKGVAFADATLGWVVGDYGLLLRTANGGATWTARESGTDWDLDDVEAISRTTAVAVGMDGVVRTTDSGLTWKRQTAGLADVTWLRGVDFASPACGFAVGWSGEIYRTTDGGVGWTKQPSGVGADLESVCFLDSQRGWAVGENGTVVGTTDGGATWAIVGVPTTQDLNDIAFVGAEKGWIVGYNGTVLTTTDGGVTWIAETAPGSPWLRSAALVNETGGWAVGLSGAIVHLAPGPGDVTPPHTVVTGASDRWRRSPLQLTPAATDASGVQRTEARIDDGAWLPGAVFSVAAPSTHEADGLHRVDYRSVDTVGNTESYHSTEVRIDTRRPTTKAPYKKSVRRYQYVRLYYKVTDAPPCAEKATVTIKIKTLGGTTKKTLKLGQRAVNKLQSYRFKCSLAKRTYRYWVYATDAAGNTQSVIGKNYLYVK